MLQNAVHPLEELRAIKTQADQHKTQSGVDLTYEQYIHLLVSAAMNYDSQFLPKNHQGQLSLSMHMILLRTRMPPTSSNLLMVPMTLTWV
jgi:hypothetical protein